MCEKDVYENICDDGLIHRVQQAAAKQVWFRFEGKTRHIDIWGQDWEIEKEARERMGLGKDLGHFFDKRRKEDRLERLWRN